MPLRCRTEPFEVEGPAFAGAEVDETLPALAVPVEVPVFEHHTGVFGSLGRESDFYLAGVVRGSRLVPCSARECRDVSPARRPGTGRSGWIRRGPGERRDAPGA
jgi:hypothetical protein